MENEFVQTVLMNLRKIKNDKGLSQETLAEYADTSASQYSKILSGGVQLSLQQLSNIATRLNMRVVDIITYPDVLIEKSRNNNEEPIEAILQIKLTKDKKDQVLKLVFGENNIEILNR